MYFKELFEKYQGVLTENNNLKEEIKILRLQLGSTEKQDIYMDQDISSEFVEQKTSMEVILKESIDEELPHNINNKSEVYRDCKGENVVYT